MITTDVEFVSELVRQLLLCEEIVGLKTSQLKDKKNFYKRFDNERMIAENDVNAG